MKVLGRLFLSLATVCALILTGAFLGGQVASADTIQSWDLNVCNSALQAVNACAGPAPATVDAILNSADTTITLTLTAGTNFGLWDGGIFGFNWSGPAITVALTGSTGSEAPYSVNADNGANLDGFGKFTNAWDLDHAGFGVSNGPASLTFTLTGTGLSLSDFTKDKKGQIFASHIADFASINSDRSPATGFVADGPTPPNVPEPFTYLLVSGGLVGITAARKLRRSV